MGAGWWAVACLLGCAGLGRGEEFRPESAGVRGGVSANRSGRDFNEIEAFGNWYLPWGWELGKEWQLQTRLDFSAGWVADTGHDAALGTAAGSLVVGPRWLPLTLEAGIGPTVLSRYQFATKDFGSYVQFTGDVGLNWEFARHWRLSYRFEHMSNAHLASSNPGLNMHLFGLSYAF